MRIEKLFPDGILPAPGMSSLSLAKIFIYFTVGSFFICLEGRAKEIEGERN